VFDENKFYLGKLCKHNHEYEIIRKYSITNEQKQQMLINQDYNCNSKLGWFESNAESILNYLDSVKK
jgi:hypothetical protein